MTGPRVEGRAPGGRRGVRAAAAWLATVGLAVGLAATTASGVRAAEDPSTELSRDDLGAEVTVGYGRGADRYRWSPVEVTFRPRVPVVGDLVVRVNGELGSGLRGETVEVAAGATKVVHLLVPPGEELAVRFTPSGGQALQLPTPGERNSTAVYVGGIGAAPALPETLASLGSDRAIRAVVVDEALLDAGARAFEALDALVVPAADLAVLGDEQRHSLAVAVAQGLDLVVPVGPGDDDLPLTWDPVATVTADGSGVTIVPAAGTWSATGDELGTAGGAATVVAAAPAGDGRVVATAAAPGASGLGSEPRLWAALLQPRADTGTPFANIESGGFSSGLFGSEISVPGSLGFALFVLAFVLVVGPINALALRRWGRRELAWVTVPAVTVAFTLVAIGSAAARAPTTSPVVRAAWWLDGVGEELTAIGLQSPSRGTATVELPAGHDGLVADPWSALTGTVVRSADATRIGVPLEALQTATVVGWGPAGTPPLEATATFVDDRLEVEVTNRAATPLRHVEVHVATRVLQVDDLPAGQTTTITSDELGTTLPRSRWGDGRQLMMGMDGRARPPSPTAAFALLRGAVLDDAPGPVWVTGVLTEDPTGTIPRVTGAIEDRGTLVAVGVAPTRRSGAISPYEVQRQVLRTGPVGWRPSPLVFEGAEELLVRFRLPPDAPPGDLVSSLHTGGPFTDGGMGMVVEEDPWVNACWEVTVTDADGVTSEPEERCGDDVPCPPRADSTGCGGDDRTVEACFEDGSCQVAVRIGDATDAIPRPDVLIDPREPGGGRVGDGPLAGVEVLDHTTGSFVPASDAFADDVGDAARFVSPLGEVLLRVRGGAYVDLGQRGLGVGGAT